MIPTAPRAATPGRRKRTNPALLEKHIQEACCQILECDGWRRIRMEAMYSEKKRKGVGEPGMADDLFLRYWYPDNLHNDTRPIGEIFWIEWKRLVPTPLRERRNNTLKQKWPRSTQAAVHQKAWHALERKRGALTLIAGEDFVASVDGFRDWYKTSGLMRNKVA